MPAKTKELTPYQRIMRAAKQGVGVRLSASEVWSLSQDSAIEVRAGIDDTGEQREEEDRAIRYGPL